MLLKTQRYQIRFPRRPLVMGIVNINDDSFSGDGNLDVDRAIAHAGALIKAGADIIDVGGESARTNRSPIPVADEICRLTPFVKRFAECHERIEPVDKEQVFPPMLSLNSWRAPVVRPLVPLGIDIVNDIGGLARREKTTPAVQDCAAPGMRRTARQT